MFPIAVSSRALVRMVAAALLVVTTASGAAANWMIIRNDSGKSLVVQETQTVNGKVKRGKVSNLLPGETLREFLPTPTTRGVEVFDARNPDKPVWSGSLECKNRTQTFSIANSQGNVTVSPVRK